MSLSLKESHAIISMADLLYSFLPGSGRTEWSGHVSFRSVAEQVGVGSFWQAGSKLPMIRVLLERTLEFKRAKFEPLIIEIVKAGILYRQNKEPVTYEEIVQLNRHIQEVGFKFPDMWDADFLASLPRRNGHSPVPTPDETTQALSSDLASLKQDFLTLCALSDRSKAGIALETILNRLFALYSLIPRPSFRVVGEQIDGSFELDHDIYLVEAKWEKSRVPEEDLLVFRGKIEGKSAITRGVFIAMNGVSQPARSAISYGKQPTFFVMDGYDLMMILSEDMRLDDYLRQRRRLLAEEGLIVISYPEMVARSR